VRKGGALSQAGVDCLFDKFFFHCFVLFFLYNEALTVACTSAGSVWFALTTVVVAERREQRGRRQKRGASRFSGLGDVWGEGGREGGRGAPSAIS
jgi:hypothetical protein